MRSAVATRLLCCSSLFLGLTGRGWTQSNAALVTLKGTVHDRSGAVLAGAQIAAAGSSARSDLAGGYTLRVPRGTVAVEVLVQNQQIFRTTLGVSQDQTFDILVGDDSVTVRAEENALTPDPTTEGYTRSQLLEANPGRPGVPLSIPGFPAETASGGIKAPQYFAPGVAGDHGEPIAQFLQVGSFLFQNNLTANAHGNGYADPNFLISPTIDGVVVDNAAYNARYGDHSMNLAVTYDLRETLGPYLEATTDGRDGSVAAGWGPADPDRREWLSAQALWGNGFLKRPEARQQYKVGGLRTWTPERHQVTFFATGYYGFSRVPGLIPMDTEVPGDTIDPRQLDLTHTSLGLLTDHWAVTDRSGLATGAYFRTYSLKLQSNFGDGLIRQSEFRTVEGGDATYSAPLGKTWDLLGGLDLRRDAPRGLDLARADSAGRFQLVTSNDLTITDLAPFVALAGRVLPWVHAYFGLRRDWIGFRNVDQVTSANSFNLWPGTTDPKINVTLGRPDTPVFPQVSLSWAKAFHANDPRIGDGQGRGDLLIGAREYQMFATEKVRGTELRLTLARIANSAELAKIDPDTGLQQDVGPSINRYMTFAARRVMDHGFLQISWSAADARERGTGAPVPEAPRTIVDALGEVHGLPYGLRGQAEYEYVKAKPLGDGFAGVPLQEVRLSLAKTLAEGRWRVGVDGELRNGYSGQTLETLPTLEDPEAQERPVGVPARSYASISVTRSFSR